MVTQYLPWSIEDMEIFGYLGKDTSQIYVKDYNYYILNLKKFIDEIVVPDSGDKDLFLFAQFNGWREWLQNYSGLSRVL